MIDKNNTPWVAIAICFFIFMLIVGLSVSKDTERILSGREYIQNVFVDVDGDGLKDLIVTGEVIYNSEENPFLSGKP